MSGSDLKMTIPTSKRNLYQQLHLHTQAFKTLQKQPEMLSISLSQLLTLIFDWQWEKQNQTYF